MEFRTTSLGVVADGEETITLREDLEAVLKVRLPLGRNYSSADHLLSFVRTPLRHHQSNLLS